MEVGHQQRLREAGGQGQGAGGWRQQGRGRGEAGGEKGQGRSEGGAARQGASLLSRKSSAPCHVRGALMRVYVCVLPQKHAPCPARLKASAEGAACLKKANCFPCGPPPTCDSSTTEKGCASGAPVPGGPTNSDRCVSSRLSVVSPSLARWPTWRSGHSRHSIAQREPSPSARHRASGTPSLPGTPIEQWLWCMQGTHAHMCCLNEPKAFMPPRPPTSRRGRLRAYSVRSPAPAMPWRGAHGAAATKR